jgi:hypothetical protein
MVRFAPADPFDDETPAADPRGEPPVATPGRRSRQLAASRCVPTNPLLEQAFPSWARPPKQRPASLEGSRDAAFRAGASLALLDQIIRRDPPFAGALRQRLALRAAAACAALARHREDLSALRDAEHLSPGGGRTGPAGRLHRFWREFSGRPVEPDAKTLRYAADLLELPQDLDLKALAEALRQIAQSESNPLAAAAQASAATMQLFCDAPPAGADVSSAGKLPKSVQPNAHDDLREIWLSPNRAAAEPAMATFAEKYAPKYQEAVDCLLKDRDALLTFFDFPAEHWTHLRTSNPIESAFVTVRHRTVRMKGALSQDTARLMVFKLVMAASKNWRRGCKDKISCRKSSAV